MNLSALLLLFSQILHIFTIALFGITTVWHYHICARHIATRISISMMHSLNLSHVTALAGYHFSVYSFMNKRLKILRCIQKKKKSMSNSWDTSQVAERKSKRIKLYVSSKRIIIGRENKLLAEHHNRKLEPRTYLRKHEVRRKEAELVKWKTYHLQKASTKIWT